MQLVRKTSSSFYNNDPLGRNTGSALLENQEVVKRMEFVENFLAKRLAFSFEIVNAVETIEKRRNRRFDAVKNAV